MIEIIQEIIEEINATNYNGPALDDLKAAEDRARDALDDDGLGKGWLVEVDARDSLVSRQWALLAQSHQRAEEIVREMVRQGALPGLAPEGDCECWVAGMTGEVAE